MARTKEELQELLKNLKDWYAQDFGVEYEASKLEDGIDEMLEERFRKFLSRRIGHLPDADFIGFVSIFSEKAPVAVVSVSKEAIEASKLEPEEFIQAVKQKQSEVINGQKKAPKGK